MGDDGVTCSTCHLNPCACAYITKLRTGGPLHHLRSAALANYRKPLPHLDVVTSGDNGRSGSCPCPRCYSLRLASWNANQSTVQQLKLPAAIGQQHFSPDDLGRHNACLDR